MRAPQIAGFGVTVAVVIGSDLPIDWLVLVATLSGGFAAFAVVLAMRPRR
jgi:hypothetical protein